MRPARSPARSPALLPALLPTLLAPLLLTGCSPYIPNVQITFVSSSPLEVDTIPDDTNGDGTLSGYIAEEVTLLLELIPDEYIDYSLQPSVVIEAYALDYTILNASGQMPSYANGVTIQLDPGDSGEFPIRGVSFDQKTWAGTQFSGDPINTTASLSLTAHTTEDADLTLNGDFDIIFANFAEPE